MPGQCRILSDDERQRVHDESLKVLNEVGVELMSDRALKILSSSGAKIDTESRIARIPVELVEEALQTAPKSFTLGGRTQEFDVSLPSPSSGYVLDLGGVFTHDFRTGERRYAVAQDNEEAVRVFEQMNHASVVWPHSVAEDTSRASALRATMSALMNTSMHIQDELEEPAEVPFFIETLAAVLGSEDAVRERKLFSVVYCTLAPLVHEGQMCDAYLDAIEFDVPILIFPMPCSGSTGPGSLFSNIVLGNAEALSSLVLFQLATRHAVDLR